ncbi:MAG: peroxide stress protein YaaA [Verrucomicrobiota bacterium]
MLAVLSPAKTLDFESQCPTKQYSEPEFLDDSEQLVASLRSYSRPRLAKLMGMSPKLAELNHQRYQDWSRPFNADNAKAALLAFKGDVYTGFDLSQYREADFRFAQKHLRILSGLYGLLRPLDLIQPYRLEMGTDLKTKRGKDLYAFWDIRITDAINAALAEQSSKKKFLINLASNEYFSSIQPEKLDATVITPVFKDLKNGNYRFMSFYGKKARGMMADYIVRHRIKQPEKLKAFDTAGYYFDEASSNSDTFVFLRDNPE